jgi:uncharacterized protein (DUF58 family)
MTRAGWGALAVGAMLVALGAATRWSPVTIVGAGFLLLLAGAACYVLASPPVAIERAVEPARVEKGQPAIALIRASNRSRRSLAPVTIEQRLGDMVFRAELPRLRRGETTLRTYRLPTNKRGTYTVGRVEVPKADPFGLCRRARSLGHPQVISVGPRRIALRPLPSGMSRNLEGPSSDMSPQGSVTFHRLREYVLGDDLRTVHWPTTARLGKLVVRHYVDTAQPYTVVVLDIRPDVYSADTFEEAVDVAASVTACMSLAKAPVQLRTTAGDRTGGPAQRDPAPVLGFLTDVAPNPTGALTNELLPLRRDRGGSALVVVTGTLEAEALPAMAALARRFDHVVALSIVPRVGPVPAYPGVDVLVGTSAEEVCRSWDAWVAS